MTFEQDPDGSERAGHAAAVIRAEAAQQALQNVAVMAYFDEVERKAVDALLGADLGADPTLWLRLTTVAQTIRGLKRYLQEARDLGEYAGEMLRRIEQERERDERTKRSG